MGQRIECILTLNPAYTPEASVLATTRAATAMELSQPTKASQTRPTAGPSMPTELKNFLIVTFEAMFRLTKKSLQTPMGKELRNMNKYGRDERKPF